MPRLVMVGDHPSLHRGFSTVGRHIARHLERSGRWQVQLIGRYARAVAAAEEPYEVFDATSADGVDDDERRWCEILRAVIPGAPSRTLLLSLGKGRDHAFLLDRLEEATLRDRVRFIAYVPVDFAPLPPAARGLLGRMDVVVPYTAFGRRALLERCPRPGAPEVLQPIPHGVDLETFRPPSEHDRRGTRAGFFRLERDDAFLVGSFGRNTGHKRPDLALRIFSAFARGDYVRCIACGTVESSGVDAAAGAPERCRRCASDRLQTGEPCERARLYMHTELLSRADRRDAGGWDLERLARRYGVQDRVQFDPALRIGEGIAAPELAQRMGACDVHLLPFEGGGWELTVLETAACGVANVITDTAGPPEYAAPFSELVPATHLYGPIGSSGIIDIGAAVDALHRLATDERRRCRLAARAPRIAANYSWTAVGDRWADVLADCEG